MTHIDSRTCSLCKKNKPDDEFKGCLKSCNSCREYQREYYQQNTERIKSRSRRRQLSNAEDIKKYRADYYQKNKKKMNAASKRWQQENLEACNKKKREYYQNNKTLIHRQRKARRYGLTLEELQNLESICACQVCGVSVEWANRAVAKDDAVIDHCHESGEVRGVLCRTCNAGIGLLGDTAESLQNAINYLKSR